MHFDYSKILKLLSYDSNDPLLFNSGFFLFFLLVFFLIYPFFYKRKLSRVIYFTLFSLYFFYKACGYFVSLIVLAAVVDYFLSNRIYKAQHKNSKRVLLILSILINLGMLCYFKYSNLFIDLVNEISSGHIQPLKLVLPIGISFYTFENLSYTIDVYRGRFKPVTSFLDYLFFLSFFPKLVMGPIVRASDFIPQIRQDLWISDRDLGRGLYLILGGLFKKIVISDYININFVQYIFDDPTRHSGIECLFGVYGYAMVIYCDFSGYSDMAIGMAKWMGFTVPVNFNLPYQSSGITEFWRRWHISLSSWLKDYVYISIGGNRKGRGRQYLNLMLTMLIGGLWHGASLKFVFWGGLHGIALAIDKGMDKIKNALKLKSAGKWYALVLKLTGIFTTFHFVCFCWIFFKAASFGDALILIRQITGNLNAHALAPLLMAYPAVFGLMGLGYLIHFTPNGIQQKAEEILTGMHLIGKIALLFLFIWVIIQVKQADQVLPIYLQF